MKIKAQKKRSGTSRTLSCLCLVFLVAVVMVISEIQKSDPIDVQLQLSFEHAKKIRIANTQFPQKWDFPVEGHQSTSTGISARNDKGQHVCSCLPEEETLFTDRPGNFRWVHIPKTGTSFIITLWLYATSAIDSSMPRRTIDTAVDSFFHSKCPDCYDFALMSRYPLELFSPKMHIRRPFASLHTSHQPYGSLKPDKWEGTQELVFLREPHARVVSAFDHDMHMYGNDANKQKIKAECEGNVTCFAAQPGQMGCMTRMLTGATCSIHERSDHAVPLEHVGLSKTQTRLEKAKLALAAMAFIGLTEEWNESLCRFHQQFGGRPIQEQFQNVRKGTKETTVDDLLPSYKDPLDEDLYAFAVEEFNKRQTGSEKCYQYIPPNSVIEVKSQCIPKTCQELGKQCGEWADGCGGIRICGICAIEKRDGLPGTWRLQCTPEGQCISSCPPWAEAGLWHRPVVADHDPEIEATRWKAKLHGAPIDIVNSVTSRGAHYLSPTDAVRMCVDACKDAHNFEASKDFATKYCKCGLDPLKFLELSPTPEEYHDIYSLQPSLHIHSSKPWNANLGKEETQPKCCPPRQAWKPEEPWTRGIPIADYFMSFQLGCGTHEDCRRLGLSNGASVVSYDGDHHYCYLGRGHGSGVQDYLDDLRNTRYHLVL